MGQMILQDGENALSYIPKYQTTLKVKSFHAGKLEQFSRVGFPPRMDVGQGTRQKVFKECGGRAAGGGGGGG